MWSDSTLLENNVLEGSTGSVNRQIPEESKGDVTTHTQELHWKNNFDLCLSVDFVC